MWQRFSQHAKETVFYAQEESQRLGGAYVSTEHLLLGLLKVHGSAAADLLGQLRINPDTLREAVEKQIRVGTAPSSQQMTLTPSAKEVIDLAYKESTYCGSRSIGSEHLLLGLISARRTVAGKVLAKLEVDLDEARNAVMPRPKANRSIVDKLRMFFGLMDPSASPLTRPDMPNESSDEK